MDGVWEAAPAEPEDEGIPDLDDEYIPDNAPTQEDINRISGCLASIKVPEGFELKKNPGHPEGNHWFSWQPTNLTPEQKEEKGVLYGCLCYVGNELTFGLTLDRNGSYHDPQYPQKDHENDFVNFLLDKNFNWNKFCSNISDMLEEKAKN